MKHFFAQAALELTVEPKVLSPEAAALCSDLPWPGNVRQLQNTCRWLTVMAAGREVLLSDLPSELRSDELVGVAAAAINWQVQLRDWAESELRAGGKGIMITALEDMERVMIDTALSHTGGRKKDAAQLLGWGRNTLTRKLHDYANDDNSLGRSVT
mgnify:FL=1